MLFRHFLPGQLLPKIEGIEVRNRSHLIPALHYAQQVEVAMKQSADFFSNQVRYLGPKRATSATTWLAVYRKNFELYDVGPQGEYAAAYTISICNALQPIRGTTHQSRSCQQYIGCGHQFLAAISGGGL